MPDQNRDWRGEYPLTARIAGDLIVAGGLIAALLFFYGAAIGWGYICLRYFWKAI